VCGVSFVLCVWCVFVFGVRCVCVYECVCGVSFVLCVWCVFVFGVRCVCMSVFVVCGVCSVYV